jgi:hypothetical protein
MKDAHPLLKSISTASAILSVLGLAAVLIFLGGRSQVVTAASSTPGFTTFDAPGARTTANVMQGTAAFAIDAAGDIAGFETDVNGVHHGFVRAANGTITEFDATGAGTGKGQGTLAACIDTAGDVAGPYIGPSGAYHGFVRTANGASMSTFDAPNAGTGINQGTFPFAIDTAGDIAGYYIDAMGVYHGFLRPAANVNIISFDALNAGTIRNQGTRAFGIDTAGDIAGFYLDTKGVSHGFVRTAANGTFTSFDVPGAGTAPHGLGPGTFPLSINTAGNVAELYLDAKDVLHGFMRAASGTITSFDAPGAGTGAIQGTGGLSINSLGNMWSPRQTPPVHKVRSWSLSNSSDGMLGKFCAFLKTGFRKLRPELPTSRLFGERFPCRA